MDQEQQPAPEPTPRHTVGWRSTTIGIAEKYCPRALDFYERGAPYDRSQFAIGTAAHAVLEDLGKASAAQQRYFHFSHDYEDIVQETCRRLIEEGRDFEGEMEPPLPSDAVWAGRDLALAYADERPMPPDAKYEVGLAVNRHWQLCPYDAGAWLRCRIDSVSTRMPSWIDAEDDDLSGPILQITDYKSAWSAAEPELRSIQRKIQAVLAWLAWGENHDALKLVVVNFRLKKEFDLTILPNEPEGERVLARWRRDIETEIAAREKRGPDGLRPAAPGPRCMGCPYLHQCEAARAYLGEVHGAADPLDIARAYAVANAYADDAEKLLRAATAEKPIELDGLIVGTLPGTQRTLIDGAAERLAEVWLRKTHPADLDTMKAGLPGLLQALGLGVKQAENLVKKLYSGGEEERERARKILAGVMTTKATRKFGIHDPKKKSKGEDS